MSDIYLACIRFFFLTLTISECRRTQISPRTRNQTPCMEQVNTAGRWMPASDCVCVLCYLFQPHITSLNSVMLSIYNNYREWYRIVKQPTDGCMHHTTSWQVQVVALSFELRQQSLTSLIRNLHWPFSICTALTQIISHLIIVTLCGVEFSAVLHNLPAVLLFLCVRNWMTITHCPPQWLILECPRGMHAWWKAVAYPGILFGWGGSTN